MEKEKEALHYIDTWTLVAFSEDTYAIKNKFNSEESNIGFISQCKLRRNTVKHSNKTTFKSSALWCNMNHSIVTWYSHRLRNEIGAV